MYEREQEARNRFAHVKTKRIAYLHDTDRFVNTYPVDEVFPVDKLDFDGIQVAFPNQNDKFLRMLYGDYMQMPPVEKRKNHYPARLDFWSLLGSSRL